MLGLGWPVAQSTSCSSFGSALRLRQPVLGDDDQVLDPHPELAGQVDAGLDRDDFARGEHVVGALREPRPLVHLEADAVAERVAEVLAVAGVVDHLAGDGCRRPRPSTPAAIASSAASWACADDLVDVARLLARARRWRRCGCRRSSSRRASRPCRRRPARRGRSRARPARRAAGRRWGRRRRSPGTRGRRRARGSALRRRGRRRARCARRGRARGLQRQTSSASFEAAAIAASSSSSLTRRSSSTAPPAATGSTPSASFSFSFSSIRTAIWSSSKPTRPSSRSAIPPASRRRP